MSKGIYFRLEMVACIREADLCYAHTKDARTAALCIIQLIPVATNTDWNEWIYKLP